MLAAKRAKIVEVGSISNNIKQSKPINSLINRLENIEIINTQEKIKTEIETNINNINKKIICLNAKMNDLTSKMNELNAKMDKILVGIGFYEEENRVSSTPCSYIN